MSTLAVVLVAGSAGLLAGVVLMLALYRLRARARRPGAGPIGPVEPGTQPRLAADVVAALHIGAVVVDRRDKVVLGNRVAMKMGLLRGENLALNDLRTLAQDARGAETVRQAEVQLLHRWWPRDSAAVNARAIPIGRAGHVALLVEDVTEARRVADMRRDFIANVSHELKTPVGALSLLSEALLEAGDDPDAVRRFSGRMQHESTRLARLVSELIELSRLEGGEESADIGVVAVPVVVNEAVDRTRLAAAAAAISVDVETIPDVSVRGDRKQLTTALVNLLDNAIAYSPARTHVAVAAHQRTNDRESSVEITVTDQGIGIADADVDRIFERFYRADPARSRATGGTGLGLAIVKHVAANHGGRVAVRSRSGRGSTFTLTLPVVGNPAPAPPATATTQLSR